MRRPLLACAMFFMLATPVRAQTPWLPIAPDKAAHFGLSYAITDQLLRAGLPPDQAIAATLFIGWFKEVADGRIDGGDLGADAAGSLTAAYLRLRWGF